MIKKGLIIMCLSILSLLTHPILMAQGQHKAGPADSKVFYNVDTKIFPCKWRNKKTDPQINLLPTDEIPRMQEVIGNALGKYPVELLHKNLKGIYVLKTMFFFGLE